MSTTPDTTKLDKLAEKYLHADAYEDACEEKMRKATRARMAAWRAFQKEVDAIVGPMDASPGYSHHEHGTRTAALDRAKAKLKAIVDSLVTEGPIVTVPEAIAQVVKGRQS